MSTLSEIEYHLEQLAVSHMLLQHNNTTRKSFYKLSETITTAITTNAASPRMQVASYGGRYTGEIYNLQKSATITLKVLCKSKIQ